MVEDLFGKLQKELESIKVSQNDFRFDNVNESLNPKNNVTGPTTPNKSRLLNSHCIEKCRHGDKYMLSSVKRARVRNANIDMDQRFLGGGDNVIDS